MCLFYKDNNIIGVEQGLVSAKNISRVPFKGIKLDNHLDNGGSFVLNANKTISISVDRAGYSCTIIGYCDWSSTSTDGEIWYNGNGADSYTGTLIRVPYGQRIEQTVKIYESSPNIVRYVPSLSVTSCSITCYENCHTTSKRNVVVTGPNARVYFYFYGGNDCSDCSDCGD